MPAKKTIAAGQPVFEQFERVCGRNEEIRAKGETRGIIWDYLVKVDGKHVATFRLWSPSRNGYILQDSTGVDIETNSDAKNFYDKKPIRVKTKAEFATAWTTAIPFIPTDKQLEQRRLKQVKDELLKANKEAVRRRFERMEGQAEAMYALIEKHKKVMGQEADRIIAAVETIDAN